MARRERVKLYMLLLVTIINNMQSTKPKQNEKEWEDEEQDEEDEEEEDEQNEEDGGFIVNDDEEEYEEGSESEDNKKRKRGHKVKRRRKHQREVDDELLEDDMDLLEENEREKKRFTKLKRNRPRDVVDDKKEDLFGEEELIEEDDAALYEQEDEYEEQEVSDVNDHFEKQNNMEDIFEPGYDEFLLKNEDDMIIDYDVPERLLIKFKDRLEDKEVKEELKEEAQWVYDKLKDKFDERRADKIKETIFRVLELLRVEYCEIMYIYYYRRLVWEPDLKLESLWKIYQLDDEWAIIRQMKKQLGEVRFPALESQNVEIHPNVTKLLEQTTDIKTLRYIKQYADFQTLKKGGPRKKEGKKVQTADLIHEVTQHTSLLNWIEDQKVWLTPAQLYENIKQKTQRFKPKTPILNPKQQIQEFIKNRPYLDQRQIYTTLMTYLQTQLFNYPDLRRWMRDKYFNKTVITTTPTKKGEEDITLYSMYYQVKRIKKKPVTSFRGDTWMLVLQAEKAGLVKIDIMFEWELTPNTRVIEQDPICKDMIQLYFDHSEGTAIKNIWNAFRMEIISKFICDYFIPQFHKEIKQELFRDAEREILSACGAKFKNQLRKGPPSVKNDGKSLVVMGLVLEGEKLGLAIVDEEGNLKLKGSLKIPFNSNLETVVKDKSLCDPIDEYKPELIIVAANCRQAITLREGLRKSRDDLRSGRKEFCALEDYEMCSKISKYHMMKGEANEERAILEAISLCRLKQNAMAEILSIWNEKIEENGCLMLNLHPLQRTLNKYKLKAELERVAVEMVNLVGIDLNKIKNNVHLQKQLQFVSGLGHKKAFHFLEKLKIFEDKEIKRRYQLHTESIVGKVVYRNCSAFFKINTHLHQEMLNNPRYDKRITEKEQITLLELTRIHDQNFTMVQDIAMVACNDPSKKKQMDYEQCIAQILRNPSKIRAVQFDKQTIDYEFICHEFSSPFKDPRDQEKPIENKDAFFSILRENPETLKKYMVFSVKIISTSQNFLNVKIIDNGLFGSIKLPNDNTQKFQKDNIIKAIITRFPFEPFEDRNRAQLSKDTREEQLQLKVEMSLTFPHTTTRAHNCLTQCYEHIVDKIHPKIDLAHFTIKKEDIPTLQVREEVRHHTELRLISHPKFKNMGISQAIAWISSQPIGEFVIRQSATKKDCLTITWKFYEGVICHINIRVETRNMTGLSYYYKIEERGGERTFSSFDDMIQGYIKPMNRIMQDVISNRKFIPLKPEEVEERLKQERQKDPSIVHYYFGCNSEFPRFVVLYYMPRESKFVKELIRVKDVGLVFHDQTFPSLKELTMWFKTNFNDKDYQKYIPKSGITRLR